jgi:hypothetical protein
VTSGYVDRQRPSPGGLKLTKRILLLACLALVVSALVAGPSAAASTRCGDGSYAPKNGSWGLIFVHVRVSGVSCRKGIKILGAHVAGDGLPAHWRCRDLSRGRTKCSHGKRWVGGVFSGDAG